MTIGYWIDPEGREIEVHRSPPYTHAGKAIEILGGDAVRNPVLELLRQGWIRVSCDVINVYSMDAGKVGRIAKFVRGHKLWYEKSPVVFVDDERDGTSKRWSSDALANADGDSL